MAKSLEKVVIPENGRYIVPAGTKHRVRKDNRGMSYLEISRNGRDDFWQFSTSVTYYRFNSLDLHQAGIIPEELEQFKDFN